MQFSIDRESLFDVVDASINEALGGQGSKQALLARVADLLDSLQLGSQPLNQGQIIVNPVSPLGNAVSWAGLTTYFRQAADTGQPPTIIGGVLGPIPTSCVSIKREWLDSLIRRAEQQYKTLIGLATPANADAPLAAVVNAPPIPIQPPTPSLTPAWQRLSTAQQRQNENTNATAQMDALRLELVRKQARIEALELQLAQRDGTLAASQEAQQRAEHQANTERRRRINAEEQLQDLAGLRAFMDADNPLSPPEGRLVVTIWCLITADGTADPMKNRAVGMQEQITPRLRSLLPNKPSDALIRRICTILTWPARKNGGVIAHSTRSYPKQKG